MNRRNFLTTSIAALLAAPLLASLPVLPPTLTGRLPNLHYRSQLIDRLKESMKKRMQEGVKLRVGRSVGKSTQNWMTAYLSLHLTAEDEEELKENIVNDDFGGRQLALSVRTLGLRAAMPKLFGYDVIWDAPEFGLFPKPTPDFF